MGYLKRTVTLYVEYLRVAAVTVLLATPAFALVAYLRTASPTGRVAVAALIVSAAALLLLRQSFGSGSSGLAEVQGRRRNLVVTVAAAAIVAAILAAAGAVISQNRKPAVPAVQTSDLTIVNESVPPVAPDRAHPRYEPLPHPPRPSPLPAHETTAVASTPSQAAEMHGTEYKFSELPTRVNQSVVVFRSDE